MPLIRSSDWKYGTGSRGLNAYGDGGNDLITITTTLTEASGHPVTNLIDGRKDWQSGSGQVYTAFTDTDPSGKYIQFDFAEAVTIFSALMYSDFTGYDMGTWKWLGSNDDWATSAELLPDFNLHLAPPSAFLQASQLMRFAAPGSYESLRLIGVSGTMSTSDFGSEIYFNANIGELTCGDYMVSNVVLDPASNLTYVGASPGISSAFGGQYDHDTNTGYTGVVVNASALDTSKHIGIDNSQILGYMLKVQGLRLFTRSDKQADDYGIWQLQYKDGSGDWQDSGDPISFELPSGKTDYRIREALSGATTDESAEWRVTYVGPQQGTPTTGGIVYIAFHLLYEDGSDAPPAPADLELAVAFTDDAVFFAEVPPLVIPIIQLCVIVSGGTSS